MYESGEKKPSKIFISHSSRDLAFVKPFVELLERIGLEPENMFCSSIAGYNVPLDSNIYSYLKEQFQNYDLRVIFILSENYYKSPSSLNEMGAAWVLQHRYTSILLPQFDFRDVKGVIDQMRISIKLDSEKSELKSRLNELRDTLISEFELKQSLSNQNVWECHRDEFVDTISSVEVYWKQLRKLREKKSSWDEWIFPLQRLIEINPVDYDAIYMLGTIYAKLNDVENAIKYLTMIIKLSPRKDLCEDAKKELRDLGYVM